jgi:hypothetical protein
VVDVHGWKYATGSEQLSILKSAGLE